MNNNNVFKVNIGDRGMSRPRKNPLPSIEMLRERFDYDPDTGYLTYRPKVELSGHERRFNRELAGKVITATQTSGYIFVQAGDTPLLGHRIAWAMAHGEWPDGEIDHIDGNKTNNQLANLRVATRSQNMRNIPARNRLGYKGVRKIRMRFIAQISVNGRNQWLGTFATPELAYEAYCRAAKEHGGEFANVQNIATGSINATLNINNANK